jgi:Fic/DOC family
MTKVGPAKRLARTSKEERSAWGLSMHGKRGGFAVQRRYRAYGRQATASATTSAAGAMAHLNLVMIHPFSDGNGRMARCFQTLLLARDGIVEPQFCSVEEYLGTVQQAYYDVLAKVGEGSWNPKNDTRPWIRFMLLAHYSQGSLLAWRLKLLDKLWEEIEIDLKKRGLPERMSFAISDAAIGLRVRNSSY